jgi:hypothetical protein
MLNKIIIWIKGEDVIYKAKQHKISLEEASNEIVSRLLLLLTASGLLTAIAVVLLQRT